MKIYLASRFGNRKALREIRDILHADGQHDIVSRWIDVEDRPEGKSEENFWENWSKIDIEDLNACDCLILYTEGCIKDPPRGGMRFEEGYVYAQKKPVIVVGPRIIVFDQLPDKFYCRDWQECYEVLKALNWQR
jgi:nucleoside 2-deoxyribosyltransferase